MTKLVVGMTLLVTLFSVSNGQKCASGEPTSQETIQCCNILETQIEPKMLSKVRGSVMDTNGGPIAFALVEVFTNPAWIKKDLATPDPAQRRMIGCTSNSRGHFNITGLKKGDYELRISAVGPINVSHWHIRINPRRGRNKNLIVRLSAGT